MRKIITKLIPIFLFVKISYLFPQSSDSILVDIGTKSITVDEFITRFEFTPWPRRNMGSIDEELKLEFLKTLIAEKLLSLYAEEIKIDTTFDLNQAFSNLERMIVRDALYRKEIKNKVKLDKDELNNAIAKSLITLYVRYITDLDSANIFSIYNMLKNGTSFDSVFESRSEKEDQRYPLEVTYGLFIEEVENELFRTKPGNFTPPLKSNLSYYIFMVDSSRMEVAFGQKEYNDAVRKAEKILKQRVEERLYNEYFKRFFSKKRGEADVETFWKLVDALYKRFKWKFENQAPIRDDQYILDPVDLKEIERELNSNKDNVLVKYENGTATVKEFLRYLVFKGFFIKDSSEKHIAVRLNKSIKNFLEDYYLAEEGYRQGLHLSPEVKKDIEMWKDFYYSTWFAHFLKSEVEVTDEELENYLRDRSIKTNEVTIVNIQEILVDSLDQVAMILKELQNGSDFGELARKYSKRNWAAEKNGEFGYFPTTLYDEIGKTAERLDIGEIFAPVETKDGYSIIKLLDKKIEIPDSNTIQNYEEIKNKLRHQLQQRKFDSRRDKLVAELAQNYIKNINFELLRSLKVTSLNMFVYRYMGFGGKMTAVPIISPYTSWYEEWKKINKTLP